MKSGLRPKMWQMSIHAAHRNHGLLGMDGLSLGRAISPKCSCSAQSAGNNGSRWPKSSPIRFGVFPNRWGEYKGWREWAKQTRRTQKSKAVMKTSHLKSIVTLLALAWASTLTSQAGWIKRYLYYDMPGTSVTNLLYGTNSIGVVIFPDTPSETQLVPADPQSACLAESPLNIADNYGSYLPGYVEPPETGNYTFWICGDDQTELWLTTDAADPLNATKKQLLCSVPGWSNAREWNKYPEQQSAPVYLEKGKRYYLEILHKEGTGGDHVGLGWQLPSGALERPMRTFYLQPTLDGNDATVVNGPYVVPVQESTPGDYYSIYDGMEAVLYANLNLTPPYTVQWRKGTTDIPGATQTYYRFRARPSDNGEYYVRVNGTLYGPVTLAVYTDSTAPQLVSATVTPSNPTQILVTYSEAVTPASATNTANYSLNTATVQSAQLQDDGHAVLLKTTLLDATRANTLTISGVQDWASPANTIANTQTNLLVTDGAITFRSWGFSRPDGLDPLRHWSHPGSTALSYLNGKFIEERVIATTSYQWNLVPARDNFLSQMVGYLTPPETGFYKFAIASDDHSILYLGTTDQPASKREICYYNGSTGRWNTGAQLGNQQSVLIYLEAGKSYYLEAVSRDGTGGDGISVFWQTPSGAPLPTANQSVQASTEPFLIPAQYLSTFANPPVLGGITFRIWDTLPTDLATLRTWSNTNSVAPSYTNNMFVDERIITTNSYPWNLIPMENHYMGQIIGYLTAPETGNYRFAIASDDHSILYLGTTAQRSSKREICNYNGSTGRWNLGAQANQLSANIALVAGQRYYIEAVYRDGTGGDGVTIAWYTPSMVTGGMPFPPDPANSEAATRPYIIPAQYVSTFNTFGNVFLKTDLPTTVTAAESTRPTLSVAADGTRPYSYQWYKNDEPIAGATAASYTLPFLRQVDNGDTFRVVVANNFSSVTSVVAAVTVTADTTKPTVASVGSLFKQVVDVRFSEPVTAATATALGNYSLVTSAGTPVAISGAMQDPNDATHVTLQTAAMPETDLMRLTVQNIADLSPAANVMTPQTKEFRANNFDALTRINNTQAFSAMADGDRIYMTAGGSDIWGTADQFAFLHKTVTGNFDYKVQGISLDTVNQWCKMGPMARISTAANARNNAALFTPLVPAQNTYTPQVRETIGGSSTSSDTAGTPLNGGLQGGVTARPTIAYPSWLRLQRIGNVINYYYGTTGTNWTYWTYYDSNNSPEGPLPATLEVGLALTSHDTALTVNGIMASFTAVNDGALRFTVQPTNATVLENTTATFYSAAGGSTPYFYQWFKNNSPVPDATNAVLSLPRVSHCTDNNALIYCQLSNGYGETVNSTVATLTVPLDNVRPTVGYYTMPKINLTANEVKLYFSEWVDMNTSQNPENYKIFTSPGNTPLTVFSAALQADERTVVLSTATQTPGTTYRVVVNNVRDLACNPNTILPNSTDYYFYAGAAPQFKQRADGYIIMEAENYQENTPAADADEWVFTNTNSTGGGFSGTGYMFVPNGRGNNTTTAGTSPNLSVTGAKLVFHVDFTRTGPHIIWVRGWNQNPADAGNDDSIFVGFNNSVGVDNPANDLLVGMVSDINQSQLSGFPAAGWQWRSDRNAGTDPLTFTNSTLGLHRFIIWQREDGTLIDKIVIEPGARAAANTAAPAPCTANGSLGEPETWDYIVQPPGPLGIAITSPSNGETFPANATIPVTATITGTTPVILVEFFLGTNLLGTATSAPYTITWPNVPEGIYSLTARVSDGLGYVATSAAVQVIVDSTKPVAYAAGSLHGTRIGVYFADLTGVDAVSASDMNNYTVNGGAVTVTSATLQPDNRAVMLGLSAPISGNFSVQVKNVTDRGHGPNVMDTVTLNSTVVTWPLNRDVGTFTGDPPVFTDPIMPGFTEAIGTDGFYVHAGGSDIWNAADGMHFVYLPRTGDFDVKVRVAGLRNADQWSKAGIMVREDLDAGSRNFLVAGTPPDGLQNLITMQWRATKDAASGSIADSSRPRPSQIPNCWLRVTRVGELFSFYWGTNGTDWVTYYSEAPVPAYPAEVYVGLATTSHNNGATLGNTTGAYYRDLEGLLAGPAAPELTISLTGGVVTIDWEGSGTLWSAESVLGPWSNLGSVKPYATPATGPAKFFRVTRP